MTKMDQRECSGPRNGDKKADWVDDTMLMLYMDINPEYGNDTGASSLQ
jgi:hypothetical protein